MKALTFFSALSLVLILNSSCSGPENNGKSVNVDSSNVNGTAPVQYGPSNPTDTTSSLEPSDDTGRRANTSPK